MRRFSAATNCKKVTNTNYLTYISTIQINALKTADRINLTQFRKVKPSSTNLKFLQNIKSSFQDRRKEGDPSLEELEIFSNGNDFSIHFNQALVPDNEETYILPHGKYPIRISGWDTVPENGEREEVKQNFCIKNYFIMTA